MNDAAPVEASAPEASVQPKRPKTIYTPVTMDDGRVVEFPGRTTILAETIGEGADTTVRFDFRNSKVLSVPITHGELLFRYAAHGVTQKLRDEAAGADNVDDAYEEVLDLFNRLGKGEWSIKREGGGGFSGQSVLVQALARATGKPLDEIRSFLGPLTQAEKMALRSAPTIKPHVDAIEAERSAKSPIDAAALLGRLGPASV